MKTTSTRSFDEMKEAVAALLKKEKDELVKCHVCGAEGKPEKLFRLPGSDIYRHDECYAGSPSYLKNGSHLSFWKYFQRKEDGR